MMSHYPLPLLRLKSLSLQMPETRARPHPASYSRRVLMNASIFLFCSTTAISDINASCLCLLNLLHVGQLRVEVVGGETYPRRAESGAGRAVWDRSQLSFQWATGLWTSRCSQGLSFPIRYESVWVDLRFRKKHFLKKQPNALIRKKTLHGRQCVKRMTRSDSAWNGAGEGVVPSQPPPCSLWTPGHP